MNVIEELKNYASFGVAGNFTGHLEQAGEAIDFKNIKTSDKNAPKAIFPTYIKISKKNEIIPEFLNDFPFDSNKIIYPENEQNIQLEPECAIFCEIEYKNGVVEKIIPISFGASNDCSIRKEGAKKISIKKNWGASSKGISENFIKIDSFSENGIINDYRIASFLQRDNQIFDYGEDSAVKSYSYIYDQLNKWMIDRLNNQQNEGPAEPLNEYLKTADFPSKALFSIGATRYTDFGEHNYLKANDLSIVVLYPSSKYTNEDIKTFLKEKKYTNSDISFLVQKIVLK